jgi:hypothetical protein
MISSAYTIHKIPGTSSSMVFRNDAQKICQITHRMENQQRKARTPQLNHVGTEDVIRSTYRGGNFHQQGVPRLIEAIRP